MRLCQTSLAVSKAPSINFSCHVTRHRLYAVQAGKWRAIASWFELSLEGRVEKGLCTLSCHPRNQDILRLPYFHFSRSIATSGKNVVQKAVLLHPRCFLPTRTAGQWRSEGWKRQRQRGEFAPPTFVFLSKKSWRTKKTIVFRMWYIFRNCIRRLILCLPVSCGWVFYYLHFLFFHLEFCAPPQKSTPRAPGRQLSCSPTLRRCHGWILLCRRYWLAAFQWT